MKLLSSTPFLAILLALAVNPVQARDLMDFPPPPPEDKELTPEEEEYYRNLYYELLPLMEEATDMMEEMKKRPEMQVWAEVLGKKVYYGELADKNMRRNLDSILPLLLEKLAKDQSFKPTEEEMLERYRADEPTQTPKQAAEELQKRADWLLQQMDEGDKSLEQMQFLSDHYDKVTEAQKRLEIVDKTVAEHSMQYKVGRMFKAEQDIIHERTMAWLKEHYDDDRMFKTSKGEEPLGAYYAFLQDEKSKGNLVFHNDTFERLLDYYFDKQLNPKKYQVNTGTPVVPEREGES